MSPAPAAPHPRIAGAAVIVASIALGVASGWLISVPPWGIPAACLLAVATVGMGVGVLWMLRRSWAEKTWPPAGPDLPPDVRARRNARTTGIVFLAPLPLGIAAFAFSIAEGGVAWTRLATLAIALIMLTAAGVGLLRYARAGAPAEKPSTADRVGPVKSEPAPDPEGWRALGSPMKGTILTATMGPSVILLAVVPVQLLLFLDDVPWGLAIWLITIAVAAAVATILIRRSQAPVLVHPATERIRLRKKTLSWKDVTRAELFADPPWRGAPRTLILTLGDADGARGRVVLRRKENLALSAGDTELALRLIESSSIDLPRDKDDPRGRFSRQLYPNSLTKEEASAVVAHPPSMSDELPIQVAT